MKLTDENGVPTVEGARLMFAAKDEARANREGRADEIARAKMPRPPLPEEALLTRAELPAWVKPDPHHPSNASIFFHRPGILEVWQAIFAIDVVGAIFLDLVLHEPTKKQKLHDGDVTPLPGCVLIAVGVEQIRRARGGR